MFDKMFGIIHDEDSRIPAIENKEETLMTRRGRLNHRIEKLKPQKTSFV